MDSRSRFLWKAAPSYILKLKPHNILPPYGCRGIMQSTVRRCYIKNRTVLQATVEVGSNVTATARQSYDSWDQLEATQGNREAPLYIRTPSNTLTVVAAIINSLYGCRRIYVRWPYDARNIVRQPCTHLITAVRFSMHQRHVKIVNHLTTIARSPYDDHTVTLRYYLRHGCGVAVSEKN